MKTNSSWDGADFGQLLSFYEHHLLSEVLPFWTGNCIDWAYGGINTCVTDEGVVQSTDKYMWPQGRALWVFSALHNEFPTDRNWLQIADNIASFIMHHAPGEGGAWPFCLHRDGTIAISPQSVYADAYVMSGLTEYARATGDNRAIQLAVQGFHRTSPLLDDHSTLPTQPLPIPNGLQAHGPSMVFANVYHDLALLTGDSSIAARALELAEKVMNEHVRPDRQLLFEFVLPGGGLDDSDAGKTFLPGHGIESMWIMEQIYSRHGRQDRVAEAMEVIRWNMEKGWDDEYGGIFLACHTEGGAPRWQEPDAKMWWPHAEALYGLLRAYQVTGEAWCLDWYRRVHDYSFSTFPNREHGDWHQNLDRQGRRIPLAAKSLADKDMFHIPRALILSRKVLRALAESKSSAGT